jgi:hypothetical protein
VFTYARRSFPVIFIAFIVLAQPVSGQATLPTVTLTAPSAIAATTATAGGNVTAVGSAAVTARGVVWSTSANPTTASAKTADGSGTGSFVSKLTGLGHTTTYHIRAYATSTAGTGYSKDVSFTTKAVVPTVKTTALGAVGATTATSGGTVSDNGGTVVTARGVVWATHPSPSLADSKTTDGSGNGTYSSALTGLTRVTSYHMRAYATNSSGTGYGNELTFTTKALLPVVVTGSITGITGTTATSGGTVSDNGGAAVKVRGVVWATHAAPTLADSKTTNGSGNGTYSSALTGLTPTTLYHLRSYATNSSGTGYGSELTFTTKAAPPTVTLTTPSAITTTTATAGGNVTAAGSAAVTARGVVWSTHASPTTADAKTVDGSGTGSFVSKLTGLVRATTYHIRAYATSTAGTGYSQDVSFTSKTVVPTVKTTAISAVETTTATSGGTVSDTGGADVTARGVVWATHATPTLADSKTTDGYGKGTYSSTLTGVTRSTTYHVRAYATNSVGTGYGSELTFTTKAALPILITESVTGITGTTATSGGQVTSDGGGTVTVRGVVWSAHINPTIADAKTVDSLSNDVYTSQLTGLTPGGEYHVRAYATNAAGTGYGGDILFTATSPTGVPTVTTAAASLASSSTATAGGNVTSANGKDITDRGIVWAADKLPTLADNKLKATGTTGAFTLTLTGLKASTAYYARAYATNAVGTGYGSAVMVATLNGYGLPAAVSPLVSNRWLDYTPPYNAYYPSSGSTKGQATCGPTALAKLLGYGKNSDWQGSIDETDGAGYHWKINLAQTKIDFSKVYDWLDPNATQAQYDQTAKIFLAAGAVGNLNGIGYGTTSESLFDTFAYYFKLSPALHMEIDWNYTAEDWQHLVEWELAHGRPLMVAGRTPESPDPWQGGNSDGHWWVVDGYNDQDQVHATYDYTDSSSTPIAGYFPMYAMGPVTTDGGKWDGYTKDHFVGFDFQPAVASTASPKVETWPANNPTATTVRLAGSVVGQGNVKITRRGFYITPANGSAFLLYAGSAEGHFTKTLTGLEPSTAYTVQAFGTAGTKSYFGEKQQFETLAAGTTPDEVMPLIDTGWTVNTWPYNAGLPAYPNGPNNHFYNEFGATALARLLAYWRSPVKGTGTFGASMNWNGTPVDLTLDLSTLNLDYTQMPNRLANTATASDAAQIGELVAATESFSFGSYPSGAGNLRSADLDSSVVPNLVSAWGLDPGLKLVKQESVSPDTWALTLKTEIAAGRPVLVQGRTTDSAAPGQSGNVNSGWFLVNGYNADGLFHVDAGLAENAGDPPGWFPASALGTSDPYSGGGFTKYNRALIGFKPKE